MAYRLLMLDFDGVLADSFPFFRHTFNQLAAHHGFRPVAADELPALRRCGPRQIARHVGLPWWKLPRVARHFIQLMQAAPDSAPLFAGVADWLDAQLDAGQRLALVSSNSRANVARSVGEARLARFAAVECGSALLGKAQRLRQVLRRLHIAPEHAAYLGDQPADGDAAQCAGVDFIAVGWGYASLDGLRPCQPALTLTHPAELFSLLPPP